MSKCGKLSQLAPQVFHAKRDASKLAKSARTLFACVRVRKIRYSDGASRWGVFVGERRR